MDELPPTKTWAQRLGFGLILVGLLLVPAAGGGLIVVFVGIAALLYSGFFNRFKRK